MGIGYLATFAPRRKVLILHGLGFRKLCGLAVQNLLTRPEKLASLHLSRNGFPTFAHVILKGGELMAVSVKPIGAAAAKWSARAGVAINDYLNGVAGTQKDQAALAAAAQPQWAAAVAAAAQAGTFAAGLNRAGTAGWKSGVAAKGATRYAPGVAAALPKYTNRFGPFLNVIANLDLGPRFPRGDARNQQRSVIVQTALNKARMGK
jgi:hypothetical protein